MRRYVLDNRAGSGIIAKTVPLWQWLEGATPLLPAHNSYAMLANNYYEVGAWGQAAEYYLRAEEIYRNTHDLVVDSDSELDSAILFSYVRAQADMHLRRLDAPSASAARAKPQATAS